MKKLLSLCLCLSFVLLFSSFSFAQVNENCQDLYDEADVAAQKVSDYEKENAALLEECASMGDELDTLKGKVDTQSALCNEKKTALLAPNGECANDKFSVCENMSDNREKCDSCQNTAQTEYEACNKDAESADKTCQNKANIDFPVTSCEQNAVTNKSQCEAEANAAYDASIASCDGQICKSKAADTKAAALNNCEKKEQAAKQSCSDNLVKALKVCTDKRASAENACKSTNSSALDKCKKSCNKEEKNTDKCVKKKEECLEKNSDYTGCLSALSKAEEDYNTSSKYVKTKKDTYDSGLNKVQSVADSALDSYKSCENDFKDPDEIANFDFEGAEEAEEAAKKAEEEAAKAKEEADKKAAAEAAAAYKYDKADYNSIYKDSNPQGSTGGMFGDLTKKGSEIFYGMRDIIYVVAGFGIIAIAVGGFFGKLNWRWLSAIVIGLMVLATTAALINYLIGDTGDKVTSITDTLK